jgi:hypothetical protein
MTTVNVGDIITAAQYNDLQTRILKVLGNGTGDYGYGQAITSDSVAVTETILASHMNDLYADTVDARTHQTGTVPTTIAQLAVTEIIGADASNAPNETIKGHNDYNVVIGQSETDRLVAATGQMSAENKITSTRTNNWGGTPDVIQHVVSVTFAGGQSTKTTANANHTASGADHMRYFFNAGGEIRFSAALSGGSGAKYNDWNSMLTNMGTIKFGRSGTTATGTGTTSAVGYANITTTYQQIFRKQGSGVYAENDYIIEARIVGTNTLQFRIYFRDDDTGDQTGLGGPVDENVGGSLTSTVSQYRATGSYVAVPTPTYVNDTTLQ